MVGGVINKPAIDSSGDIYEFCQNLEKLCLKNEVTIKTNTEVKEILTEGHGNRSVLKIIQLLFFDENPIFDATWEIWVKISHSAKWPAHYYYFFYF